MGWLAVNGRRRLRRGPARGSLTCRLRLPLLLAALMALPGVSPAAETTVVPWLKVRGEYDDNVLFSRTTEIDDYLAIVSPGLSLDYATAVMSLRSTLNADILRYRDQEDLNTENQRYAVDGTFGFVERLQMTAGLLYVDDTTLDSELEETGLVGVRSDRKRFEGRGGIGYQVTELSELRMDYEYTKTDYDFVSYVDYDSNAVVLAFNRRLGTGRDTFSLQPFFTRYDSDLSRVDAFGLSLGWIHAFGERMNLTAYLGARYSDIEYTLADRVETENKWGGVSDIALSYSQELAVWTLGYLADLRYSAYGEPINVHRGYGKVNWRITERFGTDLAVSYYYTKSEGDLPIRYENRRYLEVRPVLFYRMTEDHRVELGYTYGRDHDKAVVGPDKTADRNRVWISFHFSFPTKW